MAAPPLVSVAVPVFNGSSHLSACLASILTQELESVEIVISDGGSTDGSQEILKEFDDPRLRVLPTSGAASGLHANWERVLSECRGEFVKLVCQDDLLTPGCLDLQAELLRRHPSSVLVAGRRSIIDERDRVLIHAIGLGHLCRGEVTREIPSDDVVRGCIRAGTNLLGEPASVMLRRSALPSPAIDDRWTYAIDIDLYMRSLTNSRVIVDRRVAAAFRVTTSQLSVVLASQQAREMRSYVSHLAATHPDVARPAQVRVGRLRATFLSAARRVLYAILLFESRLASLSKRFPTRAGNLA